jgi:hypothetical protein
MVFNTTFNNISVISWLSVLLMEEIGENYAPFACHDSFVMQAQFNIYFYTPHNEVVGGYTGFTLSVRL